MLTRDAEPNLLKAQASEFIRSSGADVSSEFCMLLLSGKGEGRRFNSGISYEISAEILPERQRGRNRSTLKAMLSQMALKGDWIN